MHRFVSFCDKPRIQSIFVIVSNVNIIFLTKWFNSSRCHYVTPSVLISKKKSKTTCSKLFLVKYLLHFIKQ